MDKLTSGTTSMREIITTSIFEYELRIFYFILQLG